MSGKFCFGHGPDFKVGVRVRFAVILACRWGNRNSGANAIQNITPYCLHYFINDCQTPG